MSMNPPRERFRANVPRPAIVTAAFWVIVGTCALAAVDVAVAGARLAAAGFDLGATVAALGAAVVVAGLIRIGIAVLVLRGSRAARMFLTVVSALSLVLNIAGAPRGVDPIALVAFAATIAAVVMIWLPAANQYYAAVSRAKQEADAGWNSGSRI